MKPNDECYKKASIRIVSLKESMKAYLIFSLFNQVKSLKDRLTTAEIRTKGNSSFVASEDDFLSDDDDDDDDFLNDDDDEDFSLDDDDIDLDFKGNLKANNFGFIIHNFMYYKTHGK